LCDRDIREFMVVVRRAFGALASRLWRSRRRNRPDSPDVASFVRRTPMTNADHQDFGSWLPDSSIKQKAHHFGQLMPYSDVNYPKQREK
jgi:hypothetical protein